MPTVNIFHDEQAKELNDLSKKLKSYLAKKLSCADIKLTPEEVSIRLIRIDGGDMIGRVELEIKAHAFKKRVEKQDEICNDVRNYIMKEHPSLGDVRVWLILSELGHSW